LQVTLAESQRKKASFLAEAVRQLRLNTTVHAGRAETLPPGSFNAVWMRAVEKSPAMLPVAASLVSRVFHVERPRNGWLCLFGTATSPNLDRLKEWTWERHPLPDSSARVLYLGQISRVFHVEQKATFVV